MNIIKKLLYCVLVIITLVIMSYSLQFLWLIAMLSFIPDILKWVRNKWGF